MFVSVELQCDFSSDWVNFHLVFTCHLVTHHCSFTVIICNGFLPSVLWRCWFGVRKSIRPVKNCVVRCWRGYLSAARCKWFAYGPADATAILSSLASEWLTFLVPAYPRCPGKETVKRVSVCLSVCLSVKLDSVRLFWAEKVKWPSPLTK